MTRRTLTVTLAGVGSAVRGQGARALVVRITGRAPVRIPRGGGWSVQEKTARDVAAVAELRGYDVVVSGPDGGEVG